MAFRRFQEYLKDQNNLVEKPPVEDTPDYKGPTTDAPAKSKADKMAGGSASDTKNSPKPYSAGKNAKDPNTASKGFAHEGDEDLKYEPKTTVKSSPHGGEEIKSWPKSDSVAEWLQKTRKLSNAKFINEMKSEACDFAIIKEAAAECAKSNKNVSNLVIELKRQGLLEAFAAELCKHKSTLPIVIESLKNNPIFLNYLNEYGMMMAKHMDSDMPQDDMEEPETEDDMESNDESGMEGEEGEDGIDDEDMDSDEDMESDEDMGDSDEDMGSDEDMEADEEDADEMDDSALDEPIHSDEEGEHHHAKHALKKMGPPPGPIDSL